ncbi:hypothetical protein F1C76_21645 [Geodermatophilaceae bacterium NBWT11]|nr:hypothetical protein F1C76_21645 [Geodermatophilaceae bacterium NBWT11]
MPGWPPWPSWLRWRCPRSSTLHGTCRPPSRSPSRAEPTVDLAPRSPTATAVCPVVDDSGGVVVPRPAGAAPGPVRQWWSGGTTLATCSRFAVVGGVANVVFVAVFLASSQVGGEVQTANAIGSLLSAALANELHRRYTFTADQRVRWFRAQTAGIAAALAGLTVTAVALAVLHLVVVDPSRLTSMAVSMALAAGTGLVRFVVLRRAMTGSTVAGSTEAG